MFPILYYKDLDYSGLKSKFDKVVTSLSQGDFKSADVKKLKPTGYFRAKLDDTNRLLFLPVKHQGHTHFLMLEVIKNHDYNKSRFLAGSELKEENIIANDMSQQNISYDMKFVQKNRPVRLLDKFIMFDDRQDDIIQHPLPLIIIGSAGSGKTSVTLEKLKTLTGHCLYISLSSYLVSHTQKIYYAHGYQNSDQELDFLSFEEFLETIKIPGGKEITASEFMKWFHNQATSKNIKDGRKLFEEFRGVITGADASVNYLSKDRYMSLGVKQSIYLEEQRQEVYQLFEKYLNFLKKENYHDSNITANEYQSLAEKKYDAVVIDEVQDFTNSQLSLVLNSLKQSGQFLLCGDANQIVHPNFFSWSNLKSYFHTTDAFHTHKITQILTKNYRNSPEVTELANRILKFKNYRFGSVDKESHYLVESVSQSTGEVSCLGMTPKIVKEFNEKTSSSIHYAVLVLHESDKAKAALHFKTPLIFTVQEAKGLEYQNIILYNFISNESRYTEIAKGMDASYLTVDFEYARAKKKTDKSLETYKFYINALYVAVTRSVKNVYLIEEVPKHRFLQLLEVNEINNLLLQEETSSSDEWQKEASKLAMQGKKEQAQAIEEKVLKKQQVPWEVINKDVLQQLIQKCLVTKKVSKKEQITLLNYALVYNDQKLITQLTQFGLKAAQNLNKSMTLLEDAYFREYMYRNSTAMLGNINRYGIAFRNTFNMTPLMCAAYVGNSEHIAELTQLGADINEVDNNNQTALFIALSKATKDDKYLKNKLPDIYQTLIPDAISLQINDKLIKIPAHKGEFLLLLWMMMYLRYESHNVKPGLILAFTAVKLFEMFSSFSDKITPVFRKKRQYISSILSKNEVNSTHPYNYKLFKRIKRGVYTVNPDVKMRISGEWVNVSEMSDHEA
ncbi:AAA family ATPase [Facilibium subflavum]|uniref:AAA family ATPase n=1 Tax=Facilibium subflavum TaxID=2219058 RepID=UPI000E65B437|nr:AAA family ATPase [Facilibium subflavum]